MRGAVAEHRMISKGAVEAHPDAAAVSLLICYKNIVSCTLNILDK